MDKDTAKEKLFHELVSKHELENTKEFLSGLSNEQQRLLQISMLQDMQNQVASVMEMQKRFMEEMNFNRMTITRLMREVRGPFQTLNPKPNNPTTLDPKP